MALSVALNTARSSLQATQSQISVVARNTAGASDPTYSRKIASLVAQGGAARVTVARASDIALYTKMLSSTSDAATQKALLLGLEKLNATVGDTDLGESPAARIGALMTSLEHYAKSPDSDVMAKAFLSSASNLVTTLNQATSQVQAIRQAADVSISNSVSRINDLLTKFDSVNREVMRGHAIGADVTDSLDNRDGLIAQLSEEIGVTVVHREGGDIALYTDSGVPLFERTARPVTFDPTTVYGPNTTGNAVFIDGIQVTGAGAPMPLNSGNLVGQTTLRDDVTVDYQSQLDDLARGLIEAFAESDQSASGLPDAPGVFTYAGATGVPTLPATVGLAALLKINSVVDPAQGGSYDVIRDGGINGGAYRYNPAASGDTAFSDRLYGLKDAMETDRPFNAAFGFGATSTLGGFSTASASWLQGVRQKATSDVSYQNTLLAQASEALSNATDVNMDQETAHMLQLEQSYAASAKLISVIDQMMKTLLNMVG
ncbi:flagellar hook-associated protein FlgK [Microvirga brassicacearum]|uniref:Flagellar hook-associated protein 1 n=1 Tax=Microvirga brassicacearum TaxID=2580413 RepID=A0A5N3P3L7_9HYPH|nr:flagellar hook-associated protein FlgK [Microvirga brassicacearum]KAB0264319.1 flagellar hook-associated protein FlgK [Microvirga brassicacearum]